MKHSDPSGTFRPSPHWTRLAAAGLLAITLAGCGGSGDTGATGATGPTGPAGPPGAPGAPGASPGATVNVGSNSTPATAASAAAWAALAPQVTITGVTIASPPVVTFKVTDAAGNAIVGLANKSQSATATVAGLTNIAFTLAKLVPATTLVVSGKEYSAEPSKWVSYLVTRPPTKAEQTAVPAGSSCNAATGATWCGTFPTSDTQGTLVDNGDGTYQYTFLRDPKQSAATLASLTDSVDGFFKKADAGDVSFDPTLTTRLGIQIGGNAPGTGSNTPNGVTTTPAVAMVNTANAVYDFRPDGGAVATTRDMVKIDSCSSCHDGKVLAHGSRKDPKYCVTCHTDQIKYGFNGGEAASTNGGFTLTGTTRPTTSILDGRAVGNFPNMIHKTHMGKELVKTGYFFNAASEGKYNEFGLPQDPANCTKCHSANAATANDFTAKLTADGDNWMSKPSLLACGACHDGINFANGTGVTLADRDADVAASKPVGTTQSGHIGGAKADNTTCNLCHDATTIPISHRTNFATPNNQAAKAGVATFAFDIKSVTLNASKQPVVTFKITQDGVAVTSFAVPTLDTNVGNTNTATPPVTSNIGAVSVSGSYEPIPGFAGGPSFYVAYAVPQDGIATPADFNARQNVSLTNLLIPSGSPKAGSVTGPDANGYFTATLTGDTIGQPGVTSSKSGVVTATPIAPSPIVIPANAKMVTAAMFGSFTQKSAPAPTYTAANVKVNPNVSASGGLARPGILKKLVATGYTARRVITDATKCNACHDQLGTNPSFHGGARNDPTACAICHNGTLTSNGWVADSSTFIHGIHGASKRTVGYTWAGASATDNYSTLGYPGVLKDCDQCHLPNTVNFGAAGATLQPNLLWSTGATGTAYTASNAFRNSPYIVSGTNYGNNFSFTPEGATVAAYTPAGGVLVPAHIAGAGGETVAAQNTTLVSSPISSACFACHDTASAKNHMLTQGGAVYEPRSTALLKGEACLVCHGVGKDKDVAVVHQ